jgi:hypothetical protein
MFRPITTKVLGCERCFEKTLERATNQSVRRDFIFEHIHSTR